MSLAKIPSADPKEQVDSQARSLSPVDAIALTASPRPRQLQLDLEPAPPYGAATEADELIELLRSRQPSTPVKRRVTRRQRSLGVYED